MKKIYYPVSIKNSNGTIIHSFAFANEEAAVADAKLEQNKYQEQKFSGVVLVGTDIEEIHKEAEALLKQGYFED